VSGVLWALVGLPALVGAVLVVSGQLARARADRAAPTVAVIAALATLALAATAAVIRPSVSVPFVAGAPARLAVDGLSAVMVVTVACVALLVLVFSVGDIEDSRARFFGTMLIFVAAVLVTATATTVPVLLFSWEIMGATSWALIAFWWREPGRVSAGATAFLTTRVGDLGLYAAAGAAVAAGGGSLSLDSLPGLSGGWLHVAAAGILLAAAGKAAQLPFSFWLSRAMEGPSPVSALLHSAAMVAMGGYLLLRVHPLLAASGWADDTTAWLGAITALVLGAIAVAQTDLKQLLAASTSAQLGFVVLAAGVGAINGGTMHLVGHAATKALLFLAAGSWLSALGTKSLAALRGAGRRYPLVGVSFAVGGLSLAGLPPLALWATKDEVLAGALARSPVLYAVGLAGALLSAVYAGKAVVLVLGPPPRNPESGLDTERPGTRRVPGTQRVPLVILAVGAAALGAQALPPVARAYQHLLGTAAEPGPGPAELATSAAVAVAGLVAVLAGRRRLLAVPPALRPLLHWGRLEQATHALLVRPTVALAATLASFDDRVLDRAVVGVPTLVRAIAGGARRLDERGVDGLVFDVAGGARRLGALARRPQTGQVHQYYAQAVVVLLGAVVVLLVIR